MISQSKKKNWKKIVDKLVMDNCLILGHNPKLTNKKFTKYILGTRHSIEVFKLYELRYLLLRIYPLIYSLFNSFRILQKSKKSGIKPKTSEIDLPYQENKKTKNLKIKSKIIRRRNKKIKILRTKSKKPKKKKKVKQKLKIKKEKKDFHLKINLYAKYRAKLKYFSLIQSEKKKFPQILFASVTSEYAHILEDAAKVCRMAWHSNRWLNGSITAAVSYLNKEEEWDFNIDTHIQTIVRQKYAHDKENIERTKEKTKFNARSRWPALIIIPDVINNAMIIKETKQVGMPVIGLVNSACTFVIDYPIFIQDTSIYNVHFFCHFIAALIAKEMIQVQHKMFIEKKSAFLKKGQAKWKREIIELKKKPVLFELYSPIRQHQKFFNAAFINKYVHFRKTKRIIRPVKCFMLLKNKKKKAVFVKNKIYFYFPILKKRLYLAALIKHSVNKIKIPKLRTFKAVVLNKIRRFLTFKQQELAQIKLQFNSSVFQKWLKVQWTNGGRLRYNNQNLDYYWKPLALTISTDYIRLIKQSFKRRRNHDDYITKNEWVSPYARYKQRQLDEKKKKIRVIIKKIRKKRFKYKYKARKLNSKSIHAIRSQKKNI